MVDACHDAFDQTPRMCTTRSEPETTVTVMVNGVSLKGAKALIPSSLTSGHAPCPGLLPPLTSFLPDPVT